MKNSVLNYVKKIQKVIEMIPNPKIAIKNIILIRKFRQDFEKCGENLSRSKKYQNLTQISEPLI